ncbi:MAG: hypothetical protein HYV04_08940 [Deltaproteobacteria bacterium]|nr:hypothetical protein [Deltaproteobacteria bacterium]
MIHRSFVHGVTSLIIAMSTAVPVSAGTGWYLLKPPLREGVTDDEILRRFPQWRTATKEELHEIAPEVMGDWDAPLHRWTHEGSFDTAAECEAVRIRLMKAAKAEEPEFRKKYPDGYPTLRTTLLRESRCIASDDPRLQRR